MDGREAVIKETPFEIWEWESRADFEFWWEAHSRAFHRFSVDDPEKWEEVAKLVEKFQRENPQ